MPSGYIIDGVFVPHVDHPEPQVKVFPDSPCGIAAAELAANIAANAELAEVVPENPLPGE